MKFTMQRTLAIGLLFVSTAIVNCSKNNSTDSEKVADSSSSGVVAGAVGGALSNSSSGGTQAYMKFNIPSTFTASLQKSLSLLPKAAASALCPTFRTNGAGCSTSGSSMWLSYSDCTFTGNAEWNGIQEISMSAGTAACGTFPNPGASNLLYRQYVQSAGASVAGSVTLTTSNRLGTVDDAVANLGNFDGQTIAAVNTNGGYGTKVTFAANGARSHLDLGHRLTVNGSLDHSVTGSIAISENPGAATRTLNGRVTVYHNLLKVVGTSTLTGVIHDDVCCLPVLGTITTAYTAGQNVTPSRLGQLLVGHSEVLTFTGCGTATLQGADGTASDVTLNRCF